MREFIRKILKENDFEWLGELSSDLPFEIGQEPTKTPKRSNMFKVKTIWTYGDLYLREEFLFDADNKNQYDQLVNLVKFYPKLMNQGPETWREISTLAKGMGLGLGSYDNEELYGTPKDMSDFVIGTDYPAWLEEFDIYYYNKDGVEYPVNVK